MQAFGRPSLDERVPELILRAESKPTALAEKRLAESIRRHLPLIWRILRREGLRRADAEDGAQNVFWILCQRLDDVPLAAEKSFLISTALRVASAHRQLKWNRDVTETLDSELTVPDAVSPEEALHLRQARVLLDETLQGLEPEQRQVFVLLELEQMTRDEVAQILGIAPGTVASRMRRARESFEAAARRIRLREKRSSR